MNLQFKNRQLKPRTSIKDTSDRQIREIDKRYQFVKLCISLTKQGFNFRRQKGVRYALVFDKLSAKRLMHPQTKAPFVNKFLRIAGDKTKECYQFEQWAGR